MDEFIRRIVIRLKYSVLKRKNIRLNKKSNIDLRNCDFEGDNYVGDRTVLRNCVVGRFSYIADQSTIFNTRIGRFCSISSRVNIVCGKHPTRNFVSTHPVFYVTNTMVGPGFVNENKFEEVEFVDEEKKYIVDIGNDVLIGDGVSILDGVKIADGTIIAAGAVVTKSTEPYSIVGGVPAKLIRYRFDKEQIEHLNKIKWWEKDVFEIKENSQIFDNVKKLGAFQDKMVINNERDS